MLAHHTIMTMTQSCANPETGDTCDMAYSFDVWSANEDLPEMATRQTFTKNYMHAMGLDDAGNHGVGGAIQPVPCALQGCHDENGE